jgi:hypothetical protein
MLQAFFTSIAMFVINTDNRNLKSKNRPEAGRLVVLDNVVSVFSFAIVIGMVDPYQNK